MGMFEDLWKIVAGKTITTRELAYSYDTSKEEVEERMRNLVDRGVFREVLPGVHYTAADDVDTKEMVREFRSEFSDLRNRNSEVFFRRF